MRKGQNPAKFVQHVAKPQRITVAVLTYAPFLSGYYAQMLDVVKACLSSLWEHSDLPHDLLVFDNGSGRELVDFLLEAREAGRIQFLILSQENLGKGGAWNIIFEAAPGEVIAYTDCDALFYPGWLSKSVEILETFPKVGMVTARPFRTPHELFSQTVSWAKQTGDVRVEEGSFIPWEAFFSFVASLGTSEEQAREWYRTSHDIRLTYRGVKAQVGASHWQFTAYKSVLQGFLPFDMSKPMGQVRELDRRMNEAGYLRLMTDEPLAQNMSNRIELAPPGGHVKQATKGVTMKERLLELGLVKRVLLGIHDGIFRAYYE